MVGFKRKVYIASPYWHEELAVREVNVRRQITTANALISTGFLPFWPLSSHYLAQDGIGRNVSEPEWLDISTEWIRSCHLFLRLSGTSKGADVEEAIAEALDIPIYYELSDLVLGYPST